MKRYVFLLSIFFSFISLFPKAERIVYIDKPSATIHLLETPDSLREEPDTLFSAPVCLGENYGQKERNGDHKTPEGEFRITMIQNSASWTHDFHDGAGKRRGAYGPWFMRLSTPQSRHIGIHGTCFPESMGKRESEGCIRLLNSDLEKLKGMVSVGTKVIVTPDTVK